MGIKSLMNNPYAWVILSVCTIMSFVFGIYTWFAGKRKKEFSYISNSQNHRKREKPYTAAGTEIRRQGY